MRAVVPAGVGLVTLLLLVPLAIAAGGPGSAGGYAQTYTQSASNVDDAAVDLTVLSSTYAGGPSVAVSLTLAAPAVLDRADYSYRVGVFNTSVSPAEAARACGTVQFSNNSTHADAVFFGCEALAGSAAGGVGSLPILISDGGRTLTVALNVSWLPPPDRFAIDASSLDSALVGTCIGFDSASDCAGTTGSAGPTGGLFGLSGVGELSIVLGVVAVCVTTITVVLLRRRTPPHGDR